MTGQELYDWIRAQHAAGRSVLVSSMTRAWRVAPKNAAMVRLDRDGHVRLQCGKRWDSINFCRISVE